MADNALHYLRCSLQYATQAIETLANDDALAPHTRDKLAKYAAETRKQKAALDLGRAGVG